MSAGFADYAEQTPARGGASVPAPGAQTAAPGPSAAADEAVLMNVLRLLNRAGPSRPLTPVERSFVLGARAMFEELAKVCGDLLAQSRGGPLAAEPAAGLAPAAEGAAATESRRAGRRPTPGGGAQ